MLSAIVIALITCTVTANHYTYWRKPCDPLFFGQSGECDGREAVANAKAMNANTCGGTAPRGARCADWFSYKGTGYMNRCITADNDGKPWCYTDFYDINHWRGQKIKLWVNCDCGGEGRRLDSAESRSDIADRLDFVNN